MLNKLNQKLISKIKGFLRNPLVYFGIIMVVLAFGIYSACVNLDGVKVSSGSRLAFLNSYSDKISGINKDSLFTSPIKSIPLETPDLKIIQDNTLGQVSTPSVVSGKVLGDVFGGSGQDQKEVANYLVQPGDTLQSIASQYNISLNTLLWANDLSSSSSIKVGQELSILPVDGLLHVVKSGDTVSNIAQTYKTNSQDVIAFNSLNSQDDIYIGDVLVVPGGVMPRRPVVNNQIPVVDNFFIFPVQGRITQGLHFYNAVDIANKCGTPIYAAAAGVVQRAVGNGKWNSGMGNHLTILHSNGTVTYYGHLMTLLVKPGNTVYTGQNIGFVGGAPGMAGAGRSTGCHLHFQVIGARNPLSVYLKGSTISYK